MADLVKNTPKSPKNCVLSWSGLLEMADSVSPFLPLPPLPLHWKSDKNPNKHKHLFLQIFRHLSYPSAEYPLALQPSMLVIMALLPARAEANASKPLKLDEHALSVAVESQKLEKAIRWRQYTGQGKVVNAKTSAGMFIYIWVLYCVSDISSRPFVLISGTVIAIILTIFGAVSLLYSVGSQPLPNTLLATAVTARKEWEIVPVRFVFHFGPFRRLIHQRRI